MSTDSMVEREVMVEFSVFERLVEEAGLTARRCTQYHWQINGGVAQVNWWPTTNKMQAKGGAGHRVLVTIPKAIALAKAQAWKPSFLAEINIAIGLT